MVTRKSTPKLSMYIQKETITMQISTKQLCSLQIVVTLFHITFRQFSCFFYLNTIPLKIKVFWLCRNLLTRKGMHS